MRVWYLGFCSYLEDKEKYYGHLIDQNDALSNDKVWSGGFWYLSFDIEI